MNYTLNEKAVLPWIVEDRGETYGYRVNILNPYIGSLYRRFIEKNNIPPWRPLSDEERFEFELAVIPHLEKKFKCKAPPPDIPPTIRERLPLDLLRRIYPQE